MIDFLSKVVSSTEFWSGLGGAVVGGGFTLWGTIIEGRRQERQNATNAKEERLNVLIGIKAELECLFTIYNARMAEHMSSYDGNSPFLFQFPVTQNYFTFYESNSLALSKVSESTLNEIVALYASSRSLVDSFRGNNVMIEKLIQARRIYESTGLDQHREQFNTDYNIATDYGVGLKDIHLQTMKKYQTCLASIALEVETLKSIK
ncbi:hypothetical protein NER38_002285 [Klebsiella aerogenes]|nr:hypothetical protein [Klebsiella aerogenes]